jgi:hypothetical protein
MNPLTEEEKLARTKRRMIYLKVGGVAVIIAFIFFQYQGCQKSKNAQLAYKKIEDSLRNEVNAKKGVLERNAVLEKEKSELEQDNAGLVADNELAKGALIEESDKISRLVNEVRKAKGNKDIITQLAKCDSLTEEVGYLQKHIGQMLVIDSRKDSLHKAQLRNLQSQKDNFETAYNNCIRAAEFAVTELPKIKPKSKLYIDGAAMTGYVNGLGGGLSLIDTKGNRFAAKYMLTNVKPIYMVEYGRLLSFKRK